MSETMEVRGQHFDVYMSGKSFATKLQGVEIEAPSWDALYKKLMDATKNATLKLNIPFVRLVMPRRVPKGGPFRDDAKAHEPTFDWREGRITGIHGHTGNPLVTWDDGTKEQVSAYGYGGTLYFRPLTAEERQTIESLYIEEWELAKRLAEWQAERSVHLRKAADDEAQRLTGERPPAGTRA